jgi:ABC-type branched-subunit amino acid transport system ATPase component
MADEVKILLEKEPIAGLMPNEDRRQFVKRLASLGLAIPAAVLLVDGATKVSSASPG